MTDADRIRIPKRIAGVKLPKPLRRAVEGALAQLASPAGRVLLASALEAAAAMAVLATFLSRLATELMAWSTWEYGFLELADRHCAVSSIMPQKKRSAPMSAAGCIPGAAATT